MITKVTHVTIWVKDQDEALKFYRDRLGFKVITDDSTTIPNYRWLGVAPQRQDDLEIVLNLATTPERLADRQTGILSLPPPTSMPTMPR
jgi:catechol 2,3-dioxygenase-like lactoylglutathione lyase family enzyme